MKLHRAFTLALVLLVAAAFQAAATGTAEKAAGKPGETVPMRYVVPGSPPERLADVMQAVNDKLAKDGVGIKVEVVYIGWDVWTQRTNVMLSTGEPFELLHIMDNWIPPQTFAARGALKPLNDILAQYGKGLMKTFTDGEWDAEKLKGQIYSIPARWTEHVGKGLVGGEVYVRKDLLDKYGLSIPKTPAELLDTAAVMQQKIKAETGETWYIWNHTNDYVDIPIIRSYPSYPFYVDAAEEVIYLGKDGTVKPWFETEEFKMDAAWNRDMYTRGLRHPDVLSIPSDQVSQLKGQGRFLFGIGTAGFDIVAGARNFFPDIKLANFYLNPSMPVYESLPVWNSNAVPSTTQHPEAGVKFLAWLYGNKENHDLFTYGRPGVDYEAIGANRMKVMKNAQGAPLYQHPTWQIQFVPFARFDVDQPEDWVKWTTEQLPGVKMYPNVGFVFDRTPVATEYANVLAERQASMWPIKFGIQPYDEAFPAAIGRMKAAGLDKIAEEYAKQYNAWKQAK